MTCVATTSPTRFPAAAPASTALRTAATSPRTIAVTRPASIFSHPTKRTLAAFTIASAASIIATSPRHSTIPSASIPLTSTSSGRAALLLPAAVDQFNLLRAHLVADGRRVRQRLPVGRDLPLLRHVEFVRAALPAPRDVRLGDD